MSMLSLEELAQLAPAESVLFPSPIPVQSVSSDEFMHAPQTPKQREFEARVKSIGSAMARHHDIITPTFKVKRNRIEEIYSAHYARWASSRRKVIWEAG